MESAGAVVLNARLPWPAVLDLPSTFRPEVAQALQERDGSKITSKIGETSFPEYTSTSPGSPCK